MGDYAASGSVPGEGVGGGGAFDLDAAVSAYLTAFRAVNGPQTQPPSDFQYRRGWLSFRHYGVTHRYRKAWLADATHRLHQRLAA